jgi:citrate synthase
MNPFWRDTPLEQNEALLLQEVFAAHAQSAYRENCSTQALQVAACGSRNLAQSLIAALSTLGERHAPLGKTYEFLSHGHPEDLVSDMIERGQKVPGWGNSFHQGPDPIWEPVSIILQRYFGVLHTKILAVTQTLHGLGKPLQPNPSTFTAATALILGIPKEAACYLFIAGRLTPWCHNFLESIK